MHLIQLPCHWTVARPPTLQSDARAVCPDERLDTATTRTRCQTVEDASPALTAVHSISFCFHWRHHDDERRCLLSFVCLSISCSCSLPVAVPSSSLCLLKAAAWPVAPFRACKQSQDWKSLSPTSRASLLSLFCCNYLNMQSEDEKCLTQEPESVHVCILCSCGGLGVCVCESAASSSFFLCCCILCSGCNLHAADSSLKSEIMKKSSRRRKRQGQEKEQVGRRRVRMMRRMLGSE